MDEVFKGVYDNGLAIVVRSAHLLSILFLKYPIFRHAL